MTFRMRARSRTTTAAVVTLLASCASPPSHPAGRLVIVGGALAREHGEVYRRMLDGVVAPDRIAVLPTASGAPSSSGATWVEGLDAWAARPVAHVIPLTVDRKELAHDPGTVEAIRASRSVFFTGGDQSRIVEVLRPESGDTACFAAIRSLLARGGTIAGSSAGTAMMCDPMIRSGGSRSALESGARFDGKEEGAGVRIGRGMGFFPYGLVDQHFLARGRLGRLLVALVATDTRLGFGVEEDSALDVDLSTGQIETLGPRALLLVDAADVRREDRSYLDARISLLGNGDLVDACTGAVRPAAHKRLLAPSAEFESVAIEASPWDGGVLTDAITRLGAGEARTARIANGDQAVVLRVLPVTRFWSDARTRPRTITVENLGLDVIVPRTPAGSDERLPGSGHSPQ